jgi:hypothetical protein
MNLYLWFIRRCTPLHFLPKCRGFDVDNSLRQVVIDLQMAPIRAGIEFPLVGSLFTKSPGDPRGGDCAGAPHVYYRASRGIFHEEGARFGRRPLRYFVTPFESGRFTPRIARAPCRRR